VWHNSRHVARHPSNPLRTFALFCLPVIAILGTGHSDVGEGWRTAVWTAALSILGAACIANAARCGRVHCYITGPFFLVIAVLTLLNGVGVVPLGANGWNVIGLTILVGAISPELPPRAVRRKISEGSSPESNHS